MVYKPKQQYQWCEGYSYKTDANVVGGMIEHLEKKHGGVTRELFLEASRPEDSQTHNLFEWDDQKAAEKYRLYTAKSVIGALRVVMPMESGDKTPVRAFVNVSEEKTVYENISSALSNERTREIYLNKIRAELDSFIQRNRHIEELAQILIESAEKLREGR